MVRKGKSLKHTLAGGLLTSVVLACFVVSGQGAACAFQAAVFALGNTARLVYLLNNVCSLLTATLMLWPRGCRLRRCHRLCLSERPCCEASLQGTTEQQGSCFAQTSAAVHWCCITAHMYEGQISTGVFAVAQA
ncbi:TPA: hypothetical protein ACH3X1_016555 [Trebouxia sp. C0004]